MENSKKSIEEILEELKKSESENDQFTLQDKFWAMLIFWCAMRDFTNGDADKENYLKGKVDAYEKVIRRLF